MSEDFKYSIGHEIISKYEQELLTSLPELYPDEGERQIVEQVLIPQFRAKLEEVIESFYAGRMKGYRRVSSDIPISSYEIPDLCGQIDEMIRRNRKLLAVTTLFKPALKEIRRYRNESKEELEKFSIQQYLVLLAQHGITDRQSLLAKGAPWFMSKGAQFPPVGSGRSFLGRIFGRVFMNITSEILEEVADRLGWKELSEKDAQKQYLELLKRHGITDRQSLLTKGVVWFNSSGAQFPPFGSGRSFLGRILGKTVKHITTETLEEVADRLGWKELSEKDTRQQYLELLKKYGITDRQSLLAKGARWFQAGGVEFPPFGGGHAFFGSILGRRIKMITTETLEEVADRLGWKELSEKDAQKQYLKLLKRHGITDRQSLLAKGASWFYKKGLQFPPCGGGHAFLSRILGKRVRNATTQILEEVADKLGWKELSEKDAQKQYLKLLKRHGITDRQSLLAKGVAWFISQDAQFPPFGGGFAFLARILDRRVKRITIPILKEAADKLGWIESDEKNNKQYKMLLARYGIINRQSLLARGSNWFKSKDAQFSSFYKGHAFISRILGRHIKNINIPILHEVADKLGW